MSISTTSVGTNQRSRARAAQAAAALGLLTTWNAASAIEATATTTITVGDGVSLFSDAATVTIHVATAGGSLTGDLVPGTSDGVPLQLSNQGRLPEGGRYSFLGAINNGDGTSDLVMSFPGDGSVADGVVWTSLFVDNQPDEQRVFEPQVLQELSGSPVFGPDGGLVPGSQLDRLDTYYRDLTGVSYGQTATLIAFNGPGNTGVVIGTINITPAPGAALLFATAGLAFGSRRRRA